MVDIKTAVGNAMDFAKASLGAERTTDLRLEEIESSNIDSREAWLITLSNALMEEGSPASVRAFAPALGADIAREYKIFTVAKDTGDVLSMKIRLLAVPIAE